MSAVGAHRLSATNRRHADRLAPLVTDRYLLEQFDEALTRVRAGRTIKTVVSP